MLRILLKEDRSRRAPCSSDAVNKNKQQAWNLACLLTCLLPYFLGYLLTVFFLTCLLPSFVTFLLLCLSACLLTCLLTSLLARLINTLLLTCERVYDIYSSKRERDSTASYQKFLSAALAAIDPK